MRWMILALGVATPVAAQVNHDFETEAGCMNRLAREISISESLSGMESYWTSKLAPARAAAPANVDRIIEIKGEIAALQYELVGEMLKVCAAYK